MSDHFLMAVKNPEKPKKRQGSIVAMYYIICLGTPTGLNPSGAARTGKYESWMGKNIPIPPKQKSHAKKYTNMIDAFNSFLPSRLLTMPDFISCSKK